MSPGLLTIIVDQSRRQKRALRLRQGHRRIAKQNSGETGLTICFNAFSESLIVSAWLENVLGTPRSDVSI